MSETATERAANEVPDEELETDDGAEQDAGDDAISEPIAQEASAPPPLTQQQIEARMRKLEAQAARHRAKVAEIMGDDIDQLVASPLDWPLAPGFVFPALGFDPDQLAAVDSLLGRGATADLKPAPDAEACPDCNALGDVLTGSRKEGQVTKMCPSCAGSGWRPKMQTPQPVAPQTYGGNGANTLPQMPAGLNVADTWGRPFGHRDYGIDPRNVNA